MELKQHQDGLSTVAATSNDKIAWATPRLATLDAADAEGGANPINPEGAFATGS